MSHYLICGNCDKVVENEELFVCPVCGSEYCVFCRNLSAKSDCPNRCDPIAERKIEAYEDKLEGNYARY